MNFCRVRVKICGLTSLDEAQVAARAGADALGFVFHAPSPRFISPEEAGRIASALPPFVTPVAVVVNPERIWVEEILRHLPHALLQFHGEEPPSFCDAFGRPYIKAVRVHEGFDLLECYALYPKALALLADAFCEGLWGGTGRRCAWDAIPQNRPRPLVLAGGLSPDNIIEAISVTRPEAVDLSSGVEDAPGKKNLGKIKALFSRIQSARKES